MQQTSDNENLPMQLLPFLWRYLKNKKRYLVGYFVTALVWACEMAISPYLLRNIIDAVVGKTGHHETLVASILVPAGLFLLMSVLLNMVFRLYDYLNLQLNPAIKAAVNKDMFSYLIQHSHTFFQNNFAGSLTKKIYDMASYVDQIFGIFNEWFYPRIFATIIASVMLYIVVGPVFAAILFSWAVFFVYLSFIAAKKSEKLQRLQASTAAKLGGTMADAIGNMTSIKLFANVVHETDLVNEDLTQLVKHDRNLQWEILKFNVMQGTSITVLIAAMLGALIYGSSQGWVSPGDFAFVLMLSISFVNSVFGIGQQMLKFSRMVGICNEALSFMRVPHAIVDVPGASSLEVVAGAIKFEQVYFNYENNKPLFVGLNVAIKPGEKVGLVGYSGGGKSTFIKLLLRLLDIQSGRILIDGQNIRQVSQDSLRKQIGTIPQEPDLFHRSIMENIRFARPEASDEAVIAAAKRAHCHEFITELPEQYQALVGERGIKLSGGQKQRIAIARAFLKNAPILLLDEATAALDSLTERYIQASLHEVMRQKTTLVIAHRLSTLKDMDRILVFVKGNIVEEGTLAQLLENKTGHFYQLWQMQSEGFVPAIADNC